MRVGLAVAACGLFVLVGCSGGAFNSLDQAAAKGSVAGARLAGSVHGGQQPIVGAHVYLFAANTTGYGGAGIAASSSNASLSLLTAGSGTSLDTSGGATNGDYYVTTDANGGFSISGDYLCAQNQQVYLYALGGNPGSGTNTVAGLMAVLGNCPAAGNFATQTPFVMLNEVSTVAAAYAMAGFATDATHVGSSGTPLAQTGIANAFANAGNLVTLSTGAALATTPAGNGTVPQAEINTLGNVLAACVNSTGAGSSACTTLLGNALSGGTTGTQPSDTASVTINIAHNPGTNVANLYGMASGTPPFAPGLGAKPNDFTIGLAFAGRGFQEPFGIAIDSVGNAWIVDSLNRNVTKISNLGAFLSGNNGYILGSNRDVPGGVAVDLNGNAWVTASGYSSGFYSVAEISGSGSFMSPDGGYTDASLASPTGVAIDTSGNAWIVDGGGSRVTEFSSGGSVLIGALGYGNGGMNYPTSIAIDVKGNAWIANVGNNSLTELSSSGAAISGAGGFTGGGLNYPQAAAIDSAGHIWAVNHSGNSVSEFSSSGLPISGTSGYTGGGLNGPQRLAIDGSGNVWIANGNGGSVVEFSNSGVVRLSGVSDYPPDPQPFGIAIDGSGNVWTGNYGGAIVEIIGAAAPVVTPVVANLIAPYSAPASKP